jgi:hypothetical protein
VLVTAVDRTGVESPAAELRGATRP